MLTAQEISERYSVNEVEATMALMNIQKKRIKVIGISGKIAAGKDTVMPLLLQHLNDHQSVQDSYGKYLKNEVSTIMNYVKDSMTSQKLSEKMGVADDEAEKAMMCVADELENNPDLNGFSRTDGVRKLLQYWGTDVRRLHDGDYWVKQAFHNVTLRAGAGFGTHITDARFPNEADAIINFGGTLIRLDVSPEIQRERVQSRDNIALTETARTHFSEIALDDYDSFTMRINTDDKAPEEIVSEILRKIK